MNLLLYSLLLFLGMAAEQFWQKVLAAVPYLLSSRGSGRNSECLEEQNRETVRTAFYFLFE